MQQPTSKQLFAYWDHIRNGRIAPRRFEIEPAKIANILRETFIAE
ncbi:PAS domain-containing protein, partial [Methyloceanibacter sp.]